LVALGFGVPLGVGLVRLRAHRGLVLLPALVTCAFTVWLAATNIKPYNVRYVSVALPAFLLVVAFGWSVLSRRMQAVTAVAALATSVWACGNYLFEPRYGRDDVRGAVAYVARHAHGADAVVQISLTAMLRHYYTQLGPRPVHPPAAALRDAGAAAAFVRAQVPSTGVVWYLECRPEAIDPAGVLRSSLQSLATGTEMTEFVGVRVYRCEIPVPAP
jgi:hypothetical protein